MGKTLPFLRNTPLLEKLLLVSVLVFIFSVSFVKKAEALVDPTWVWKNNLSGSATMNNTGDFPCQAFGTNLGTQEYRIVLTYTGLNCCGAQSDGDGIWFGGNNAVQNGLNFTFSQNQFRFQNDPSKVIATTNDGATHTIQIDSKKWDDGNYYFWFYLDGNIIPGGFNSNSNHPDTMSTGGSCTDPGHFWNWNNFNYNVTFYDGVRSACTPTSSTCSTAASTCGSGNPFQNPLTINGGTNAVCIQPSNTGGQPLQLSVDGTMINWSAASGSLNNYSPVSNGNHTVNVNWPGNAQWCPSSNTCSFTKTCTNTSTFVTYGLNPGNCASATYNNPAIPVGTTNICVKGTNSGGQQMSITNTTNGQNVQNPANSGQGYPYDISALGSGTYTLNASSVGSATWCPSSGSVNFTKASCTVNSTTMAMASGACGSGNPFQNPLTISSAVNNICVRPTNSSGQDMNVYFDGVLIESGADSGSNIDYFGITTGTHTVTASWPGSPQYCASSDTGTVTKSGCIANTTTASVNGYSIGTYPVGLGQSIMVKGVNMVNGVISAGVLQSLTSSVGAHNPNWSAPRPPQNDTLYTVNAGFFQSGIDAFSLTTHRVDATGGGGAYCTSYNSPAVYYSCSPAAPSLSGFAPGAASPVFQTVNAPPTTLTWQVDTAIVNGNPVINFGMDQCGSNITAAHGVIPADTTTISLYSGFDGGSGVPIAQKILSGADASGITTWTTPFGSYTFPVSGTTDYSWRVVANNGAATLTTPYQNFQLKYLSPAWYRTDSGYVFAQGKVGSPIPTNPPCVSNCKFNTSSTAGSAAVVSYANSTPIDPVANFNSASNISTPGWLAQSSFDANSPSYSNFLRQAPTAPLTFPGNLNWGQINNTCHPWGSDPCYLIYNGNLTSDNANLGIGSRKVVLFVNGSVDLSNNQITVDPGVGFFGIIASGSITIEPNVDMLNGLFFTDQNFTTKSNSPSNDTQLVVTGAVIAKNGITLSRDLGDPANKTLPAEIFNYDPSLPFTLPRALKRLQFQINEVPPTQ